MCSSAKLELGFRQGRHCKLWSGTSFEQASGSAFGGIYRMDMETSMPKHCDGRNSGSADVVFAAGTAAGGLQAWGNIVARETNLQQCLHTQKTEMHFLDVGVLTHGSAPERSCQGL